MAVDSGISAALEDIVRLYNDRKLAELVDRYWARTTVTMNGHTIATSGEETLAGETAVLLAAPDRTLRLTNAVADGRVAAVQAVLSFTDRESGERRETHWSAFWRFAEDFSVEVDNAYFDPSEWPGASP